MRTAGPRGDVSETKASPPLPLLPLGATPTAGTGGATLALLALALNKPGLARENDDDDDDDVPSSNSPLSEVASVKKGWLRRWS